MSRPDVLLFQPKLQQFPERALASDKDMCTYFTPLKNNDDLLKILLIYAVAKGYYSACEELLDKKGVNPDFLVDNKIIIELKVRPRIGYVHIKQLLAYLKMTELKLAIIIYFTQDGVKYRRIVNSV